MSGRLTRLAVRALDKLALLRRRPPDAPAHQVTGRAGEEDAYFYLREHGYVMVARNYRVPQAKGELDLIGWDGDVLCFIEVKTRTTRDVKPAEAAVDAAKQRDIATVARYYLKKVAADPTWRFDVVSVYRETANASPEITLFKNAFTMS